MRVRLEVDLAASAVGDMRVPLGRPEIRVSEHLLDRAEIGPALEQVRREGVAEEVGMHAARLEACAVGELSEDQERACASQRAAADVEEQLRPVPAVEMWAAEREISTNGLRSRTPEGDEALFISLRATLPFSSPTASDTRRPAPYRSSTRARSRNARGPVPVAASMRRSVSEGERARGNVRARRGN